MGDGDGGEGDDSRDTTGDTHGVVSGEWSGNPGVVDECVVMRCTAYA